METFAVQSLKLALVQAVGLSKDALHVYVGLIVFFVVVIALRKRSASPWPLTAVMMVAIVGELVDMRDDISSLGVWRWRASIHDVLNTAFWPFVITVLVRAKVLVATQDRP